MEKKKAVKKRAKKKVTKKAAKKPVEILKPLTPEQLQQEIVSLIDMPLYQSYRATAMQFKQVMIYKSQIGLIEGNQMMIEIIVDGRVK